jgi:hypothetical protein
MIRFVRDVRLTLRTPCREHVAVLSKGLDTRLRPGIAVGLWVHMRYCKGCLRYRAQLVALRAACARLGQESEAGEAMPDAVRERVRLALMTRGKGE